MSSDPSRRPLRVHPVTTCASAGGRALFNPSSAAAKGLSQTKGVAAFPSGIVYRVGDPAPALYLARLAISQTFGLGGGR